MCPWSHEDDPSNPLSLDASAENSLINLHLTALTISLLPFTLCDTKQQLRLSSIPPLWQSKPTYTSDATKEDEGIMRKNRQIVHSIPFIKGVLEWKLRFDELATPAHWVSGREETKNIDYNYNMLMLTVS